MHHHGESVFEGYKNHFSGPRDHTLLAICETIRRNHPDQHITQIQAHQAGLLKFAEAGLAEARLIRESNELLLIRDYTPPRSRLERGDGKLEDHIFFGLFDYTWQGHKLQFYSTGWTNRHNQREEYHSILTPKKDVDARGQSPLADALIKTAGKWNAAVHKEIYIFDSGRWSKNTKLWSAVHASTWEDVILDPAMKDTLINDVQGFFDSRAVYEEYSVPWKRGIIFHGTPGCGKTISIKALMRALEAKDVVSLYVKSFDDANGKQQSIRRIFQQARIMAPCMLVFEDLDSLVTDDVRSYFLNEVDGLEDNNGILMIGSTNHLAKLDVAITKRPSRFDRKYHFRLPGEQERVLYCQYWRGKLQKNRKVEFDDEMCRVVAQLTEGFSFAYMKELFVQSLLSIVSGRADAEDVDWDVAVTDAATQTKVAPGSGSVLKGDETVDSSVPPKQEAEEAAEPPKMPDVSVPKHLRNQPLMRVLYKQATALWKDMDNTEDESIHSRQKVASGDRNLDLIKRQRLISMAASRR